MHAALAEHSRVCPRCRSPLAIEPGVLGCCLTCAEICRATEAGAEAVDAAELPPGAEVVALQASILSMQRESARLTQRWAGQH